MIIRAPRSPERYYRLDHAIARDQRLSYAARGLLIMLLTRPDNWQVSVENLRREVKDSAKPLGRDAVYALLSELERVGYLARMQPRDSGGKVGRYIYVVGEDPCAVTQTLLARMEGEITDDVQIDDPLTDLPYPAEPYPAEPRPANPTLRTNDIQERTNHHEQPNAQLPVRRARGELVQISGRDGLVATEAGSLINSEGRQVYDQAAPEGTYRTSAGTQADWEARAQAEQSEELHQLVRMWRSLAPQKVGQMRTIRDCWVRARADGPPLCDIAQTILEAAYDYCQERSRAIKEDPASLRFVARLDRWLQEDQWQPYAPDDTATVLDFSQENPIRQRRLFERMLDDTMEGGQ